MSQEHISVAVTQLH